MCSNGLLHRRRHVKPVVPQQLPLLGIGIVFGGEDLPRGCVGDGRGLQAVDKRYLDLPVFILVELLPLDAQHLLEGVRLLEEGDFVRRLHSIMPHVTAAPTASARARLMMANRRRCMKGASLSRSHTVILLSCPSLSAHRLNGVSVIRPGQYFSLISTTDGNLWLGWG